MQNDPAIKLGLSMEVVDTRKYQSAVKCFRKRKIILPTIAQLASGGRTCSTEGRTVHSVDPDALDSLNLWRINWHNSVDRKSTSEVPVHLVLPPELTGVKATIAILLGNTFPMIRAHKVLAAYGCLVQRIVTGQFDPAVQRAIWPSTGNYARGGIAVSRIVGCRGVAVLPEGMSQERFEWLGKWTERPEDIVRTPGTESNVKEIYDACLALARDPDNVVLNQFCEFANYLVHFFVTGAALAKVFEYLEREAQASRKNRLRAFVAATGSAGTIAAGDYLKERFGSAIVAVEALECPTMLMNGFGSHNIQGIGDKHIPLIHNVNNADFVCAVSDQATDELNVLFNTQAGRDYLSRAKNVPVDVLRQLESLGLSSIANILAAIKTAKLFNLGPEDVLLTVATDGSELYSSERQKTIAHKFAGRFDRAQAGVVAARCLDAVSTDHVLQLSEFDRHRIFNLGYYTWVEQQGVPLDYFEARRSQSFWTALRRLGPLLDNRIVEFNEQVKARNGHGRR